MGRHEPVGESLPAQVDRRGPFSPTGPQDPDRVPHRLHDLPVALALLAPAIGHDSVTRGHDARPQRGMPGRRVGLGIGVAGLRERLAAIEQPPKPAGEEGVVLGQERHRQLVHHDKRHEPERRGLLSRDGCGGRGQTAGKQAQVGTNAHGAMTGPWSGFRQHVARQRSVISTPPSLARNNSTS